LHGHVDGGVEEHQSHQSEDHGRGHRHAERAGIGQQAHHQHGQGSTEEEIGYAASPSCPRAVGARADNRLHDDAHEWGQYPKITQAVGVGAKGGEDARDVGTLQGVGYLYAEESETEIP